MQRSDKTKGFGLWAVNCGSISRKCMVKTNEREGLF